MRSSRAWSRLPMNERTYLVGRWLFTFLLVGLYLYTLVRPEMGGGTTAVYAIAAGVLLAAGLVTIFASLVWHVDMRLLAWLSLPVDLTVLYVLTSSRHGYEDVGLAVAAGTAVVYASLVRRREAGLVALLSGSVFLGAHLRSGGHDALELYFLFVDAGAVFFLGYVVADGFGRLVHHEEQLQRWGMESEALNAELQHRITELHAVSEISEVIHSSLDFDKVGPFVMDVLQKVIDAPLAHLFVIDKVRSETLFSASSAGSSDVPKVDVRSVGTEYGLDQLSAELDSHFSCLPVLDHEELMVVFCTDSQRMETLTADDRLVLQAVASELAVAVENSRLYKLTRTLAITDELTGLNNYRYLQQRLDEEMERALRYDKHLSLLMLDVDYFKRYNDSHGHIAGDDALAEFGGVLRASVREVDVVARYGGEEFAVILPETDSAGAFVVAEKIRDSVSKHSFPESGPGGLTVSIGFSTYPLHAHDKESLLKQADDALYQAKATGKDRVRSPRSRLRVLSEEAAESEADKAREQL